METSHDDEPLTPPDDQALDEPDPGFGEQDEAAQHEEWEEDAREDGG